MPKTNDQTLIEHVLMSTGDECLLVNNNVIASLDADEFSDVRLIDIGKNLSDAIGVPLLMYEMNPPPDDDWNWSDVNEILSPEAAVTLAPGAPLIERARER